MARTAVRGRLSWRLGEVVETVRETPRTRSIVLAVPGWEGHLPGQHVDVRLTAEDGYQAQRSYSIASAPEDVNLVLTVERLDDGEVSPYLVDELRPGDRRELRGPIASLLAWTRSFGRAAPKGALSRFGGKATDLSAPDCASTFRGEGDGARAWCRVDDGREVATVRCAS